MSRSTFSVLFYANKSKVKNGIVPVMGRITINGTQSQFSCKRSSLNCSLICVHSIEVKCVGFLLFILVYFASN